MQSLSSLLNKLETSLYSKDNNKAHGQLLEILTAIDPTGFHFDILTEFDDLESCQINASRIISCIIQLLSDKKFKINQQKYLQLLNVKKNIDSLSRVSGFHGCQSVLNYFTQQYQESKNVQLKQSYLYKMLLFTKLSDLTDDSLDFIFTLDKVSALPFVLSLLSTNVVITDIENINRDKLLSLFSHFSDQTIAFENTGLLAISWMHCSYSAKVDKHVIKSTLNKIMKNTIIQDGFRFPKVKKIDRTINKPKILVLVEVFYSHHAMARCYTNYIIQLKKKFEVILFGASNTVDEDIVKIFDNYVVFEQSHTNIHQISQLINAQKADIIFYPSIGMSTWVIALLSVRHAPIQIMATGHPATTMCETIDYLIAPDFLLQDESCYSEKLITIPNALDNTHASVSRNQYPKVCLNNDNKILKIAINGKSSKINIHILRLCERVNQLLIERKIAPIQWCFFTNETGFLHYHCEYEITKYLDNASVIKAKNYSDYLKELATCDLALAPFPFGGSNSNIDLLRLAIPLIYLTGNEAHSRTDEFYFSNFGLVDGLASKNEDELISNLVKLIELQDVRLNLRKFIKTKEPDSLLITDGIKDKTDVVDTFSWIWNNHSNASIKSKNKISYQRVISDTESL